MNVTKKVARKAEALRGNAKKIVGRVAGNRRLRAEGREDEAKAQIKEATARTKGVFRR